jgi:ABC-2 type transport system permease protein
MSVADPLVDVVLDRPPLISTRLLRSELLLIFGRRRNWVGLAVLAAAPILIAIAVKVSPPTGDARGDQPDFLASITSNGLFVAFAALTIEIAMMLPLAVAAISGDSIAGEANLGTLRYLLTVPVHRTRTLAVKYLALMIFCGAAVAVVAGTGTLIGLLLFGGGDLTLVSGDRVSFVEGMVRLLAVCGYLTGCLAGLAALGMFVSTLTEQPIGAAIAILVLTIASFIMDSIQQLGWLHPYLLTHWWLSFGDLLRQPVALGGIGNGLLSAGGYAAVFLAAAWARFGNRDVTS